ncbi:putative uncharacterized protein PYCARD-AS1 [Heterocephalus glaber]|uniref:Uncharacterized protein n=1 Tax=Heterocephalus glaber TaxID=10181 RepID=A0AAX6QC24_HETGA|nr:putative uncharacterized protein PYCARD-AS1 [Heterocephalus glaber]
MHRARHPPPPVRAPYTLHGPERLPRRFRRACATQRPRLFLEVPGVRIGAGARVRAGEGAGIPSLCRARPRCRRRPSGGRRGGCVPSGPVPALRTALATAAPAAARLGPRPQEAPHTPNPGPRSASRKDERGARRVLLRGVRAGGDPGDPSSVGPAGEHRCRALACSAPGPGLARAGSSWAQQIRQRGGALRL